MQKPFYLYRKLAQDSIVNELAPYAAGYDQRRPGASASRAIADLIDFAVRYGFAGNIWQAYLTFLLTQDENAFSLAAERAPSPSGTLWQLAQQDLAQIRALFCSEFMSLGAEASSLFLHFNSEGRGGALEDDRRAALIALQTALAEAKDDREFLEVICRFYGTEGVGLFALYRAFHLGKGEGGSVALVPITHTERVTFDDLIGYDLQKQQLIANTEDFLAGRPANHVLLYGDGGTGKSTSLKALLQTYAPKGLRMIEVYKSEFGLLNAATQLLGTRNYRFVITMDDLSFEEYEIEYKYLKSFIEGGLECQPENIKIYATSNRRHLIRETWNDKNDYDNDLHRSETTEEKLSLASRFGLAILYLSPSHQEFFDMVQILAERKGISLSQEELQARARRWEMQHSGSISGRIAQQFISSLLGEQH